MQQTENIDYDGEVLEWAAVLQNISSIPDTFVQEERTIINGYINLLKKQAVEVSFAQETRHTIIQRVIGKMQMYEYLQ